MTDKGIEEKVLKEFPMFINKKIWELTEQEIKQLKEFISKQKDNK